MSTVSPDVAVVGGGVIGLSAAWRLAGRGAEVVVIDPDPGGGASGVAAGMIAPVTEARWGEEPLLRAHARVVVPVAGVRRRGGGRVRAGGRLPGRRHAGGRPRRRRPGRARRHGPPPPGHGPGGDAAAGPRGAGRGARARPRRPRGLLAADERSVDPPALLDGLRRAAGAAGATLLRAAVDRIVTSPGGDRVTGVSLADGAEPVRARIVVLAAGCRSADLPGLPPDARPPVRPVKGQIVTLRQPPGDPLLGRTVRGLVRGSSIYLVPRDDGRVAVGATVEERGWDTRPTAGGAYELLRDALALVPGLDDAELVAVRTGLRPGSPDDLPIVGPGAVEGLVVATGHHRNGILLAPVTADAVTAAVLGEPGPDEVAACDPRRFVAAAPAEARA